MSILLTAFGPFADYDYNPSADIAQEVAKTSKYRSDMHVEILPVVYDEARARIVELGSFDIHLALGLAADRKLATLERFALNYQDSKTPDNSGQVRVDARISGGALALESNFPIKDILLGAKERAIALGVSHSAGLYVCNTVLYTGLETSKRAGFLHVPSDISAQAGAEVVELILDYLC